MLDRSQMEGWDDYPPAPAATAMPTGNTLVFHNSAALAAEYADELGLDPATTSTMPPNAPFTTAGYDTIVIAPGCTDLSARTFAKLTFLLNAGGTIIDRRRSVVH